MAWISDGSDNGNSVFGIHTLFVALWIIFKYIKKSYLAKHEEYKVPEIFRISDSSLAFTNMEYENEIGTLLGFSMQQ